MNKQELIGTVADANPGTAGGPSYVFHDDAVSGGTAYYYVVKSKDSEGCPSAPTARSWPTRTTGASSTVI